MRTAIRFTSLALLFLMCTAFAAGAQKQPPPNTNPPATVPPQGKPDITDAKKGIIIGGAVGGAGGKFVPWGTVADLSDVDPLPGTIVEGRCAFNATYGEINIGSAATSPNYTNKLKLDGATDVAINTARHLNAGRARLQIVADRVGRQDDPIRVAA